MARREKIPWLKQISDQHKFRIELVIILTIFQLSLCSYEIQTMENDICPEEGFFPDPHSCTKFYRCVETYHFFYAYEFECPRRTVFDPDIKVCNHPYAVHPDYRCFISNLIEHRVKQLIHVVNDTTIHRFISSDELDI